MTALSPRPADRAATIAFWVATVAATVALVLWTRRLFWIVDDWTYLRPALSLDHPVSALIHAHNGQWSTIPILVIKGLEGTIGLSSYLPYAIPTLIAHLGIVVLVRRILLREGVSPWTAALLALSLLFIAKAYDDVLQDTQVGYDGSVLFALLAADLLSSGGRARTAGATVSCLLAVMSSDVGVGMLIGVAALMVCRRGWQTPAVIPPLLGIAVYVTWYFAYGRQGSLCGLSASTLAKVPPFGASAVEHSLDNPLALKFSSVVVVGVALYGVWARPRTRAAISWPLAGLIGTLAVYASIAVGRDCLGIGYARQPRYAYFAAVLLMPAFGAGIDALAARWRHGRTAAVAVLTAALAANVVLFARNAHLRYVRTHAGALQLAHARVTPTQPAPLSAVDPQVTRYELDYLLAHNRLHLPAPVMNTPQGQPGI